MKTGKTFILACSKQITFCFCWLQEINQLNPIPVERIIASSRFINSICDGGCGKQVRLLSKYQVSISTRDPNWFQGLKKFTVNKMKKDQHQINCQLKTARIGFGFYKYLHLHFIMNFHCFYHVYKKLFIKTVDICQY